MLTYLANTGGDKHIYKEIGTNDINRAEDNLNNAFNSDSTIRNNKLDWPSCLENFKAQMK